MVNGAAEALVDENGRTVSVYQWPEGEVMVPFTTLARLMGWVVTPDEKNPDGYTVEVNGYMLHVAYIRDELGQVVQMDIQLDSLPVEPMPDQAIVSGDELFLSPAVLETLLNAQWSYDQDAMTITITFPPKDLDGSGAAG